MSLQSLPLAQRLALSYAPATSREDALTLLILDARLAAVVHIGGEAMIAQIKLAWWRERLAEEPAKWPKGEPLLERLRQGAIDPAGLVPLVDGWEHLLVEEASPEAIEVVASARGVAWALLCDDPAKLEAVRQAGRQWALADLALAFPELAATISHAGLLENAKTALPRSLRPLSVLRALAMRAVRRNAGDLLDGPGAMALALRVGLFGR